MGTILEFPDVQRGWRKEREPVGAIVDPATVIILPVIRIERYTDQDAVAEPDPSAPKSRRRRRRPNSST
jgi:hypothetical protein